jgi:hypothetical protein
MDIVLPVAGIALMRGLAILLSLGMAIAAFRVDMLAAKNEVRIGVIEALLVQRNDIRRPSLVLGMALAAGLLRRGCATMKAGLCCGVASDVLVAIEAQRILLLLPEGLMALAALGLDVRVALDNLAGHHQRLDRVRARWQ